MNEEVLTLESLGRDFGLDSGGMFELAEKCGVPPCASRPLDEEEVDAIYDAWIEGDSEISESLPRRSKRPAREKILLIDTSSLLETSAESVLKKLVPKLLREGRQMIVPYIVMEELNKKAIKSDRLALSRRARDMMKIIFKYKESGAVAIYGDANDMKIGFADGVFQKLAAMFAKDYDISLITQDNDLARELMEMAGMRSVRHRKINVYRIDSGGNLVKAFRN